MLQKPTTHFAAVTFFIISLFLLSQACSAQQSSAGLPFAKRNYHFPFYPVTEIATLNILEDFTSANSFGASVAVDNDTIVVGALFGVYVFVKPESGWANMTQTAKLTTSSDSLEPYMFGATVAISGDTIAVGAPYATIGEHQYQGAAYVYVKPLNGWQDMTETAKLTTSDGQQGDYFGSVAISGDTVVVGAIGADIGTIANQGSAYVFVKPESGWQTMTETARLTPSDGEPGSYFGQSIAVGGDTVVVGALFDNISTQVHQGSAYVFVKPAESWASMTQTAKLTASDGQAYDMFGQSAAISGSTVVVGANATDIGKKQNQGAAYVYEKPEGGWTDMTQTAKLTASDGAAYDDFGASVAISGTIVAAGAPYRHYLPNPNQSSAYVFIKPAGGWADMTQDMKLTSSEGAKFARCIAVSGHTVVAGASYADELKGPLRAAYVFDVASGESSCPAEKLYGADSPEIQLLRRFRDDVLKKTATGRLLADLYYKAAPAADRLLENPWLQQKVKSLINKLLPIIEKRL